MKNKTNYSVLVSDIVSCIEQGRKTVARYVNTALVVTYWHIGRRIVEFEQKGEKRAEYGDALLEQLAIDIAGRFGKGFSRENLRLMRQLYVLYPCTRISQTVSGKSFPIKSQTLSGKLGLQESLKTLSEQLELSWSHYCLLMRLEEDKRKFYEAECLRGNWSVRQLDRQIQSSLYERVALSRKKQAVLDKSHLGKISVKPEDEIKDPYVLEFLGLKDEYSESQLEEALIQHLEKFLLELGVGFTFVARQKRITLDGRHYRLDLLLYHRVLRCLVAIDLKLGEFNHADAGQMNLYLNYLKAKEKMAQENDPIGIVLCADKRHTVAEFALGGMDNKIFASRYRLSLPDVKSLQREIEKEKQRFLESNSIEEK